MASKVNTPAEPKANPVKSLELVDALVQEAAEAITALATAARAMLALDATSLLTVAELLKQIEHRASDVENCVNAEAETCGANYIDDHRCVLSDRLWGQHHALRNQKQVEVHHG
jgi:hypothetical protein